MEIWLGFRGGIAPQPSEEMPFAHACDSWHQRRFRAHSHGAAHLRRQTAAQSALYGTRQCARPLPQRPPPRILRQSAPIHRKIYQIRS